MAEPVDKTLETLKKKYSVDSIGKNKSKTSRFDKTKLKTYALIAVLIVVFVMLAYYSYSRFVTQRITEPMYEKKDDIKVKNFDLRQTVNKLNAIQDKILRRLSDSVGI